MKTIHQIFTYIFVLVAITPNMGFSQGTVPEDSKNMEVIKAARELIISAGTCALITIGEQGYPQARVMDAFLPEEDFTVWFGTNPNTRKVEQIKNNSQVTVFYTDPEAAGYVALHGTATLINDKSEKEKRWKEAWSAYYPNRDDAYVLIKVSPEWMEVVSYAHGIVSDTPNWAPPIVYFKPNR